jgi:hypothetical protein
MDIDRREFRCLRELVQAAIRRRGDRHLPAGSRDRARQVAQDIADAADLPAGQGTIFRRQKYDGTGFDNRLPSG